MLILYASIFASRQLYFLAIDKSLLSFIAQYVKYGDGAEQDHGDGVFIPFYIC